MNRRSTGARRGMTLIEALCSVMLISVVLAICVQMMVAGISAHRAARDDALRLSARSDAALAFRRDVVTATSHSVSEGPPRLTLVYANGRVEYTLERESLLRLDRRLDPPHRESFDVDVRDEARFEVTELMGRTTLALLLPCGRDPGTDAPGHWLRAPAVLGRELRQMEEARP